ncbi:hypothetical protein D3C72_255550 [compost metagenome]
MLRFDINKLRSVYVYLVKVTSDYVYVTTHRNGEIYGSEEDQVTFRDFKISKIKLHKTVSHGFFKFNVMREFAPPRLSSLNFYGSDIVSLEIQMFNRRLGGFQSPENWQSNFSKVISQLEEKIKDVSDIWINGQEIFWPITNDQTMNSFAICPSGAFTVDRVNYVKLSRIGLDLYQKEKTAKEINSVNTNNSEEMLETVSSASLPLSTGNVLAYHPNAEFPDLEQITVYSPVLSSDKGNLHNQVESETRLVYSMASEHNPSYPSIEFAIRAAKTIGKLYGYEETDFLNIPAIIEKTGCINLQQISERSRMKTPISMRAPTSIAWIMGFMHRETDLNSLRDLSKMFKFIVNNGLVYKNDIKTFLRKGVKASDIPLLNRQYQNQDPAGQKMIIEQ